MPRIPDAAAEAVFAAASSTLWCGFLVSGTVTVLLLYGLLQEHTLSSLPYAAEYFTASVFLVLLSRIAVIMFALAMLLVRGEALRSAVPPWKYLSISFANIGSSTCQVNALLYISFPVQMLGKSCKMIPVMLFGVSMSGKRYSLSDWFLAVVVTVAVAEFLIAEPAQIASSRAIVLTTVEGLLLLVGSFALDGFAVCFQEKLFREYGTSKYNQMLYINMGSAAVSLGSLFFSGKLRSALAVFAANPYLVQQSVYLAVLAVAGQWFLYSLIQEFGALAFAVTMNGRQVASVLFTYARYSRATTMLQTFGLAVMLCVSLVWGMVKTASVTEHKACCDERRPLKEETEAYLRGVEGWRALPVGRSMQDCRTPALGQRGGEDVMAHDA